MESYRRIGSIKVGDAVFNGAMPAQRQLSDADLASVLNHLTGALNLPPSTADPAETFRPLVVADDGTIYHMVPTAGGLKVTAYSFASG